MLADVLVTVCLILIACFVLAVIAVIGHVLWELVALVFGRRRRREDPRRCVFCGHQTSRRRDRCQWCGRDLGSRLAAELSDLQATRRQVERLREAGALKDTSARRLLARLQTYRGRLLQEATLGEPGSASTSPSATPAAAAGPPVEQRVAEPVIAEAVEEPQQPAKPMLPVMSPTPPVPVPQPAVEILETGKVEVTAETPPRRWLRRPAANKPRPPRLATPRPPKRRWGEVFSGLLAERNIHWSEAIGVLVGGLLMVGASIALVFEIWENLQSRPYLKFSIFVTYSSAVFGAGLYAYRRWRLESTGRGLLIIATLLVPLNFLAMTSLWRADWGPASFCAELVSLLVFAWLVGLAQQVLVPQGRWQATLAVVGNSAALLLLARLIGPETGAIRFVAAGCLPVAVYGVAMGSHLHGLSKWKELDVSRVGALFTLLGLAVFALVAAFGLLVARSPDASTAFDRLSVLVALAAVPILGSGLTVVRGTARDTALAAHHTAGITTTLIGMLAMAAALGLAWPHPLGIVAVGTLSGAALAAAAVRWRLPVLHTGAIACAAVTYLTGFHVIFGDVPWHSDGAGMGRRMLRAITSAQSGTALAALFALFGVVSEWLTRRGRARHGVMYAGGCGAVALAGLLLVTTRGLLAGGNDALRAALLYGVYGVASLLLVARWRRVALSYVGLGLLTSAPIWALWWHSGHVGPVWATVLAAEALVMGSLAAALAGRVGRAVGLYRVPLLHVGQIAAPIAAALGVATAWLDRSSIGNSPTPVLTAASLAALYLLLAWVYRSANRTWVGSMILLVGLIHTLTVNYRDLTVEPLLVAFLVHCTLSAAAGVVLERWGKRRAGSDFDAIIGRVFGEPLCTGALWSSSLAAVVLVLRWSGTWPTAGHLLWLAAIWLVLAHRGRSAVLYAAHQAAVALASLVAVTAWMTDRGWIVQVPRDLLHPQSLHAYGAALGLLCLAWIVARILLRGNEVAQRLLSPPWPAVDRVVWHAVVLLQGLPLVQHLWPGVAQELLASQALPTGAQLAACGTGAWWLWGVLAIGAVAASWERWSPAEAVGSLLLAASAGCLVAGRFADDLAVASALRWSLAFCFVACSVVVWARRPLLRLATAAEMRMDVAAEGPTIARTVLLATTALPVLGLTLAAATLRLTGILPGGPAAETLFDRLGPNLSYLVPLAVVMTGLIGHALRERSAGFAFSAGLVAQMIVVLGYALSVVTGGHRFEVPELVTLIQLATITAALWAGAWLIVRSWVDVWRDDAAPGATNELMNVQLGMAAAGNGLLLVFGLCCLAVLHPHGQTFTVAVGAPLGWAALVSLMAASIYRGVQHRRVPGSNAAGLAGMAALGMLACAVQWACVQWLWPLWGYHTLMLGWAVYALLVAAATWWVASARTLPGAQGPPQALIRAAAVWVRTACSLAVLLALKASLWHEAHDDRLWAAAAIAVASVAGATMAVWRRQESWAFSAALGANLAASLVVWHFRHDHDFRDWWLRLLQANVIASSAVALVWLAARRRLYQLREWSLGDSPLLAVQVALPMIGNLAMLCVPVVQLLAIPAGLPARMAILAGAPGWLALLTSATAAGWYWRRVLPNNSVEVLGILGLGAGVLVTCHTAAWDGSTVDLWLQYHTLTAAWVAAGMLVLGFGLLGRRWRFAARDDGQSVLPAPPGHLVFPGGLVRAWATAIGALVLLLAVLHSAADPARPWWSAWAILSVSVMAGMVAMWQRQPVYVYVSGLLLSVIGAIVWIAWGHPAGDTPALMQFAEVNVVGLALGSAVWSLLQRAHARGVPHLELGGRAHPFAHVAGWLAVGLLGTVVGFGVVGHAMQWEAYRVGQADWIALAATVAAMAILLWDRNARWPLAGLYATGLAAVGMSLCAQHLLPPWFAWTAALEVSGFVLLAAALGGLLPMGRPLWRVLRIPDESRRWSGEWFQSAQGVVCLAGAMLGLSVSIELAFGEYGGLGREALGMQPILRLAGVAAAAMLSGAAVLMAWQSQGPWRAFWQRTTFATGLLLMSCAGFTGIDPTPGTATGEAPGLHCTVVLMVAAAAMTLLSGIGLRLLLRDTSDWVAAGQRISPVFGGLAMGVLALILAQEGLLHATPHGVPMATWAVAIVAAALIGLIVGCLTLAVVPRWDPWRLSDRGRTAYVYAAEVLAVLTGLHLWLTVPWLFRLGFIEQYWMAIVMAVAFGGAALSELFDRRAMAVLSEPLRRTALLLPLGPMIGFWWMGEDTTAAIWLLMGLFYGWLAISQRSALLASLGIVTANTGLWVLLYRHDLSFHDHPQLWLIPIALAALIAEHLDRRRLDERQRAAIRYLALSVIYVSSTTEFMREIGQSVWLPLALVLLSVLGVLAGVLLQVRSFLYLGLTFLTVVIVRMIVYAAFEQGHIWIFWSFCIVLGAAIIALFAWLERRWER